MKEIISYVHGIFEDYRGDEHHVTVFGLNVKTNKFIDIENFFVSHSHADHIGCLEQVALMNHYVKQRRPNLIITDEYKKKLWTITSSPALTPAASSPR